jgi:hypothetical protein
MRSILSIGLFLALLPSAFAQSLFISESVRREASLTNTAVTVEGRGGLVITGTGDPLAGTTVNLDSADAWLLMTEFPPSQVSASFLSRVHVQGAPATAGVNVRVVQYGEGAIVVPQGDDFVPLEVFNERYFVGSPKQLTAYTKYNNALLGSTTTAFRSFRLKRGYMVTFATQENGTGTSRCYVAADGDLEIGRLPASLEDDLHFVRVFPWRWGTKKGIAGNIESGLGVGWKYNWNLNENSPANWEYVPIRQIRYWPNLDQDWKARGATHLLGYNEPDHTDQANLTVTQSISSWPDLLQPGLRTGAPAVSDGGLSWLYDFMNQADAASLRVDFVPVHYYRCFGDANDPAGAATQFYNFLKGIYDMVQRPLWVTEWNNGANWTGCGDPSFAQQALAVAAITDMLDTTPFVERYALYNWVEDVRRIKWDDGSLTQAGEVYRDNDSAIAYRQEMPDTGIGSSAVFSFDGHARDASTSGHSAMLVGAPAFTAGKNGQSLAFDGMSDWVQLAPRIGNSTDWSFAGWVYWNGGSNWQRIFDLGLETDRHIFLTPKANGAGLRFGIQNSGAQQQLNAPALPTGTWTHVAVTISGNTGKLFVNGVVVDTNTSMTTNPGSVGTKYNYLGKSRFSADPLFSGRLDDIRFFSSAQSDSTIAAIANTPPPLFLSDVLRGVAATAGLPYNDTLADDVSGTGTLTFTKLSGADWLNVSNNGILSGTPTAAEAGDNSFAIRVTDANGSSAITTLIVTIPTIEIAIATGADDAEQAANGAVSLNSSDLELVDDGGLQIVGLRFAGVNVPQGAVITEATIQFTADEAQSEVTRLSFGLVAVDSALPFSTAPNNIGARPLVPYQVIWQPTTWAVGQAGTAQQTPNLAGLVQEVVSRPGWRSGNALAVIVEGSGHRTADAFEKAGGSPPVLRITYSAADPVLESTVYVTDGSDDAEEADDGSVNLTSSDLELIDDGGPQVVGLRFSNLMLPKDAKVLDARMQFTTDEAQSEATSLRIQAHDADNTTTFTAATNNISSRPRTSALATWNLAEWANIGERGPLQQTPDLSPLVTEIVSRPGWSSGNAIAFIIDGSGHRTANSADNLGGLPVSLTVRYTAQAQIGTFERWMADHPGTETDDADDDGLVNLLEYAFGLDPFHADVLPTALEMDTSSIQLTYTRPSDVSDADYQPEWSDMLDGNWSSTGVTQEIINDNGSTRTIRATVPRGTGSQRFLRVRVSH